jgi:sensor domain CHASE-containing protein/CheY-specific phosphatase CheX
MGIRLKILLTFILGFGLTAGIGLNLLKSSVNESYASIERGDIATRMGQVERGFEAAAASLRSQTSDWAVWNEMYRYALDPDADPEWARENIGDDALAPADLSMSMILARDGRLLSLSTVGNIDGADGKLDVLGPQMDAYLDRVRQDERPARCGLLRLDVGMMLACWAGIVQSDASGEVAGTVVMGRLLDAARVEQLREQTRLSFTLEEKTGLPDGLVRWPATLAPGSIGSGEFWTANDTDWFHLYYPVRDILGQDAGVLALDVPRTVYKQGLALYRQVRGQLVWTVLSMTVLLGLALHFMLIRRLSRFARQIDGLDKQSAWDVRIDIGGADELGLVARNFNKLLALIRSQVAGLRELVQVKEAALRTIEATQAQLVVSENEARLGQQRVRDLLDNSGEGFLTFGGDLQIDAETSRACVAMLGCSPAGRNVAQIFAGTDPAKAELFRSVIPAVLAEPDRDIRESMLSLLPAELSPAGVLLKAEYRLLENERFMVVLTDITDERRLEGMLQGERRRLEMIVAAVTDRRNFFDAVDSYREFLAHTVPQRLQEGHSPRELVDWLYREVHTNKGLFNQFSFIATPRELHAFETSLATLAARTDALTRLDITDSLARHDLAAAFEADLGVLRAALGDEFLAKGNSVALSAEQAGQLEKLASRLLYGDALDTSAAGVAQLRSLLRELVSLRKVTLGSLLTDFNGLVQQAASRLEKNVAPIVVLGDTELWVDAEPYRAFFKALGHVFRNAVVHGLETPEERWAAGKPEHGTITCRVSADDTIIELSITDDGAGIDLEAVRARAVAAGIHTADEIGCLATDAVAALIFKPGMSTRQTVSELAGRGVGLAAVSAETQRLGGRLEVGMAAGNGTEFLFTLPWLPAPVSGPGAAVARHERLAEKSELVMRSIVGKTRDYFAGEHAVSIEEIGAGGGELDALTLLDTTAVIGLGGRVKLRIAFSFESGLADAVHGWMTAGFHDHDDVGDDIDRYREAAVGEVVNTILGHCTIDVQHLDRDGIALTPPAVLGRGQAIPRMNDAVFHTRNLSTTLGRLDISIIGPDEVFAVFAAEREGAN